MLFKFLLLVVAVTAAAAEAELSPTEGGPLDTLEQWNETLKRLLEIYEILQRISEIDIGQMIADLTTPEQLQKYMLYILDNHTDNLPQQYVCLARMVVASDPRTQDRVVDFINEIVNYVRLNIERDAREEECIAMEPPSGLIATVLHQNCRLAVQRLELTIYYSHAKLSLMFIRLRETWAEGMACIGIFPNNNE